MSKEGTISRAVKVELRPTKKQAAALARACGVSRYVYNYLLGLRKRGYAEAKSKGEKYKVPYQYGAIAAHRDAEAPWIGFSPSDVINFSVRAIDIAFLNLYRSTCRAPKFKSKRMNCSFSVQLKHGSPIRGNSLQVSKIGWIRSKESIGPRIPEDARFTTMTISRDIDRWYASISLQDVPKPTIVSRAPSAIGIDLNVERIVCSDGTIYGLPQQLKVLHKRQRRAQRVLSRRQKGSNRRQVAKTRAAKIMRTQRRVREDWLHKTTTELVHKHSRVVIEDLNVQGMTASAKGTVAKPGKNVRQKSGLNRVILRAGFGEFRRQLTYKADWYGCELVVADRFFASSKTCSRCSHVKQDLSLSDRVYRCDACGLVIDRDLNAAINLSRVQPATKPEEVPAGSGNLTDVDRTTPKRSKRRKLESSVAATGKKRQRQSSVRIRSSSLKSTSKDGELCRSCEESPDQMSRAGPT